MIPPDDTIADGLPGNAPYVLVMDGSGRGTNSSGTTIIFAPTDASGLNGADAGTATLTQTAPVSDSSGPLVQAGLQLNIGTDAASFAASVVVDVDGTPLGSGPTGIDWVAANEVRLNIHIASGSTLTFTSQLGWT